MSHITKQGSAFPLKKRGGRETGRGAAWRRDRDPDATHHKRGSPFPPNRLAIGSRVPIADVDGVPGINGVA
jgi:hypothetical protein